MKTVNKNFVQFLVDGVTIHDLQTNTFCEKRRSALSEGLKFCSTEHLIREEQDSWILGKVEWKNSVELAIELKTKLIRSIKEMPEMGER